MTSPRVPRGLFVGLATLDVAQHVARAPGVDEKVTATATHLSAGGPAANAAVAFAALGGDATLLTALGSSPAAALVRAELESCGVRVVDADPDLVDLPPVSAITVVTGTGERSVVGADAVVSTVDPPQGFRGLIADADVLLVDGHHPRLGTAAAAAARDAGVPVVLDLGRWKPGMADLVPLSDAVVCSADARAPGTTDSESSAATLLAPERDVVVTRGSRPALWWSGESAGSVEVPAVEAVDTLGAGDAFHGAYAFAVARGQGIEAAVRLGVEVASLRVQHAGPRGWADRLDLRARVHDADAVDDRIADGDSDRRAAGDRQGDCDSSVADAHAHADVDADADAETDAAKADAHHAARASSRPTPARESVVLEVALAELVARARALAVPGRRTILGIAGAPGAGKSYLADHLALVLGPELAVSVPMDGFHLAGEVLESLGRSDRKGAADTFDGAGYVALLERLRAQVPNAVTTGALDPATPTLATLVLAPRFRRDLEEPVGSAIPVAPHVPLVITEGNYLLRPEDPWSRIPALLDEIWYLAPPEDLRRDRLVARHESFGRSPEEARERSFGSDEVNAREIATTAARADLVVRLLPLLPPAPVGGGG